ncbi:MAG: hypothetical protein IJ523_07400 [Succinivibrionaceae bacterium]|nr:hypothetical protein [Succinivibrionaceae bacterium]
MGNHYDFAGWATRADMRCSDGRTIAKNAFAHQDGARVPLVWNHNHATPDGVLGYGILHSQDGSMRVECFFNDTDSGVNAKKAVLHGDITALSIYANHLKEQAKTVLHGMIREISLVYAGANPGAFIDSLVVHGDGSTTEDFEQGIIYTGESIELYSEVEHADSESEPSDVEHADGESEEKKDEEQPKDDDKQDDKETIEDVLNTLNEKQKNAVAYVIDNIVNPDDEPSGESNDPEVKHNSEEEETEMKRNVFDQETETKTDAVLSHADGMEIVKLAKSYGGGSLKAAYQVFIDQKKDELAHSAADNIQNISQLFPEYKDIKPGAPELLTTDQGWIGKVLAKVHKSPISRIRTRQADVRDITNRRAKGYKKGTQKTDTGSLPILSRTTDPVTVYIRSKLDRDDIIDITDFDIVAYMYDLDRMNLNEELARQITIGDGRSGDTAIDGSKIRPIWLDNDMYCMHKTVDIDAMRTELTGTNSTANFGENYVYAEAIIQSLLYAREKYKGSGNPDLLCTPHMVNVMLLARDLNGRRIYDNVNELKAALNVNEIITAEQYEGKTRTATVDGTEHTFELLGLLVNFADYSLGATKGGEITHFTDFDINFNQEVSLLETRCSGALTRPFSAIALEMDVTDEG